ncbi:hypothetical protein Godav_029489 [Gossypium davidsonii]|uniref:Uncharacterized protein n=1 Tax=Gossypium davidsonii TaxID=34287 RepID=A0A7J8TE67_GOSDV|nr:hypothetical protein [Gossypium davidsonii]
MKSIQANNTFFLPRINGSNPRKPELLLPSYPYLVCFNAKVPVTKKLIASSSLCSQQFVPLLKHKRCVSVSKCWQGTTVCKFGGQDKPAGDNKLSYRFCLGFLNGSSNTFSIGFSTKARVTKEIVRVHKVERLTRTMGHGFKSMW